MHKVHIPYCIYPDILFKNLPRLKKQADSLTYLCLITKNKPALTDWDPLSSG